MKRAVQAVTVRSIDEEKRELSGWASRPEIDRMGDRVEPLGAQFSAAGVPLLIAHDPTQPVGRVTFGKPTARGIPFVAKIAKVMEPGLLQDRVNLAWQSVAHQIIDSVSIGFRVLDNAVERIETGLRYLKFEIVELSLVSVPAAPGAQITAFKAATQKPGVVYIGAPKKTGHVVKYGPAKTVHVAKLGPPKADHVVRLTAAEILRGKLDADFNARRDAENAWRKRMGMRPVCHVAYLTPEAKERAARLEAARAELLARRRGW